MRVGQCFKLKREGDQINSFIVRHISNCIPWNLPWQVPNALVSAFQSVIPCSIAVG
jgi:hypothetical protein